MLYLSRAKRAKSFYPLKSAQMKESIIKYNHKILKDKQLIIEVLSGNFSIDAMKTYRELLYSDRFFNPGYDLLQDIRDAKMSFTYEELAEYMSHLSDSKAFGIRKTVILSNISDCERLAEWFDVFNGLYPVQFRVVPSFTDSMSWLNRGSETDIIKQEVDTLQHAVGSQCFNEPSAFIGF
jgi:hypothetical protein